MHNNSERIFSAIHIRNQYFIRTRSYALTKSLIIVEFAPRRSRQNNIFNNKHTNVILLGSFENAQKKLLTAKNPILAFFEN